MTEALESAVARTCKLKASFLRQQAGFEKFFPGIVDSLLEEFALDVAG